MSALPSFVEQHLAALKAASWHRSASWQRKHGGGVRGDSRVPVVRPQKGARGQEEGTLKQRRRIAHRHIVGVQQQYLSLQGGLVITMSDNHAGRNDPSRVPMR